MEKIKRYKTSIDKGLTEQQVQERYNENLYNFNIDQNTKTVKQIVRDNIVTLFNIINVILALAVILVGSFKNLTFMLVIITNTCISIFQELRSKKTLDKLKILSESKIKVVREGKEEAIAKEEIVLDDIMKLTLGNQVVVDSIILDGEVEVDESFITGESDTVYKKVGDMLLSGSFVVSGNVICRVEHIGRDNYTAKIASDTKYIKPVSSEIMRSLNKIVKTISFLIIPIGILLFSRQLFITGNSISNAVVNTVAALIGMIPEGLVLLTSTVLAVSVIRLSKSKVLVQDLYCIETLARVDVICLDKTGTITEGSMEVVDYVALEDKDSEKWIGTICNTLNDNNPTANALKEKYPTSEKVNILSQIPFSSSRKYSGIVTEEGVYVIGAPEFILKNNIKKYQQELDKYTKDYRVVMLGYSKTEKVNRVKVLGFILLRDKIRKEAKDTLNYFKSQGVTLKIISGDNPNTVLNIARRAGFKEDAKEIDATKLKTEEDIYKAVEEYDIFGRVTPEQKKNFVIALQNLGHTVAMTGDGVNDVLALKEADCSVAMASGSDATKNVSQLVLLDSNFASMPKVVAEGRRTINNIERSASLFLVKTIYATLLSIIFLFVDMSYPFIPIQLTLASVLTIGIPSFILALEPNHELVKGRFLPNVMKKSIPAALTIVLNILVIVIANSICHLTMEQTSTLSVAMVGYTAFILLYKISKPLNPLRSMLIILMFISFLFGITCLTDLFSFSRFDLLMVAVTVICIVMSHQIYKLIESATNDIYDYILKKK